ncbi:MAG: glycerophosphodiester phosphodiesterase [Sandaracinaceae bacterium]|nr:glycerophosphodiester phosphodiesterase [Sandaracinaceae bacterium]
MSRLGNASILNRVALALDGVVTPAAPLRIESSRTTRVIGHRGAPREECENTLSSFTRAIELGADAIELDVCVTRDEKIIVWHDAHPDTTVGLVRQAGREELAFVPDVPSLVSPARKAIADLDLETVRAHYGYHRRGHLLRDLLDGDGQPRVPFALLDDALLWARDEQKLNLLCIDVKLLEDQTAAAARLFDRVRAACVAEGARRDLVIGLMSPIREVIETFLACANQSGLPDTMRIYADFELPGVLDTMRELGMRRLSMGCGARSWADFEKELSEVIKAREEGLLDEVIAWTIDDREQMRTLANLRVDGILTNDCATLVEVLRERDRG